MCHFCLCSNAEAHNSWKKKQNKIKQPENELNIHLIYHGNNRWERTWKEECLWYTSGQHNSGLQVTHCESESCGALLTKLLSSMWKLPTPVLWSWLDNQAQLHHNTCIFYPPDTVYEHTHIYPISSQALHLRECYWGRWYGWKLAAKVVCLVHNTTATGSRVIQSRLQPSQLGPGIV